MKKCWWCGCDGTCKVKKKKVVKKKKAKKKKR